jgi:NlpC/P60 family putative phage cell wall peptidase
MAISRPQIVAEARQWIGTPFQHQGRLRGVGVDCVGLVLCVMRDLGLGDWLEDFTNYPRQPVGDQVLLACRDRLQEIPFSVVRPGDVMVFRLPRSACHAAIATDNGMIHAYSPQAPHRQPGRVAEIGLTDQWKRRIVGCFSIPGVGE